MGEHAAPQTLRLVSMPSEIVLNHVSTRVCLFDRNLGGEPPAQSAFRAEIPPGGGVGKVACFGQRQLAPKFVYTYDGHCRCAYAVVRPKTFDHPARQPRRRRWGDEGGEVIRCRCGFVVSRAHAYVSMPTTRQVIEGVHRAFRCGSTHPLTHPFSPRGQRTTNGGTPSTATPDSGAAP